MDFDTIRLIIPQAEHVYEFVEERSEYDAGDCRAHIYYLYRCPKCGAETGRNDKRPTTIGVREGCPTEWRWDDNTNKWTKKPDSIQVKLQGLYGRDFKCVSTTTKNGGYVVQIWINSFGVSELARLNTVRKNYLPELQVEVTEINWIKSPVEFDLTAINYPILEITLERL